MAWDDKPTYAQIETLFSWMRWRMPTAEAQDAVHWLQNNATRRQVSEEMQRIRPMYKNRTLDRESCFKGSVWKEYFNSKLKR